MIIYPFEQNPQKIGGFPCRGIRGVKRGEQNVSVCLLFSTWDIFFMFGEE